MAEETCYAVDILLLEMEQAYRNVEKNRSSKIKLPAKELDLLTVLEKLRDKLDEILVGDRAIMKAIFVGEGNDEDCERIARIRAVLDVVEFSPMNAEDGRRKHILRATDSVEHVLIDLGSYDALKAAEEAAKKKLLDAARPLDGKERSSSTSSKVSDDDGDSTPTFDELKRGFTVFEPDEEDDPKEYTKRLIRTGLRGLRERPLGGEPFEYPTDPTLEQAGELALLGFENLSEGVARLLHMSASELSDACPETPDEEMSQILQFIVTLWQARSSHRAQCQFVADNLTWVSPRFGVEVERRSGCDALARGDFLPWFKGDEVVAVSVDMNSHPKKEQRDQHFACAALLGELVQDTHKRLQQVRSEFPMSQEKFRSVLENEKQRAEEQWSIRAIGLEAVHHEYYKELISSIVDEELARGCCNEMMAETHLNETPASTSTSTVNKSKRPSKEVQVVQKGNCGWKAVPMLGFRRFLKSSKPKKSGMGDALHLMNCR